MNKIALNAQTMRSMSKELGLIFEGTGKKWALRNLRKGKTWEQLGSISNKHLKAIAPAVKKQSIKGKEIAVDVYGKKRSPVRIGGIGVAPAIVSPKITKRLHTHPYEGLLKQDLGSVMSDYYKAKGLRITKGEAKSMVGSGWGKAVRDFNKNKKIKAKLTGTQRAHPNPSGKEGIRSDIDTMKLMPKANHNILNPDNKILGVHKLRPKGLREVYRKL